jgi:hypothetical protein
MQWVKNKLTGSIYLELKYLFIVKKYLHFAPN